MEDRSRAQATLVLSLALCSLPLAGAGQHTWRPGRGNPLVATGGQLRI